MTLEQPGQRGWQECWRSVQRWLTSISVVMGSEVTGGLQELMLTYDTCVDGIGGEGRLAGVPAH
jgi:hypothetical protein